MQPLLALPNLFRPRKWLSRGEKGDDERSNLMTTVRILDAGRVKKTREQGKETIWQGCCAPAADAASAYQVRTG